MKFQGARPLDPWRWIAVPALACLGATVVFAIPLRVFGLQLPEPVFPMIPVFAWAVIRPSVLAPFVILGMGLFLDLFWGGAMGLWALSLLTGYAGVLAMRSMMTGQSRPIMWGWFAGVTGLTLLTGYLFTMLDARAASSLVSVAWQLLATALLYPFANRMIDRFEDADVRFR